MADNTTPTGNGASAESAQDALRRFQTMFPARQIDIDGAVWRFRDTAAKSNRIPLVLLPGAGGTGDVFHRVIERVRSVRRVITVSYPPMDNAQAMASSLWTALSYVGIDRIDVLGSSLGGYIAQRCALQAPSRLRRCMLANTFCDAVWMNRKMSRETVQATPASEQLKATLRKLRALGEETIEQAEYKQTMLALVGSEQDADTVKNTLLAVLGAQPVPRMQLADDAIAVLDTDDDAVVDEPTRQALRDRYRESRQFRLRKGGHYPALLNVDEFVSAVHSHFADE